MPGILIAASGTGGHLFPALAVAEVLPKSWEVSWLGVPDRLDTQLLPTRYRLITVKAGGLQGSFLRKISRLVEFLIATIRVRNYLLKEEIDVVFSTGGYIAAPAIIAAKWCGLPVILHESNALPGRVTRFLGRFCNLVALGFPLTAKELLACKTIFTGTPVRESFFLQQSLPNWVPSGCGPLIVVMGGSQGAVGLNQMVRPVLLSLLRDGCRIVHLTGSNDPDSNAIQHPNLVVKPFSDDISSLLHHAALVISRAGAGALSELAICRTPAILVPYPQAADHHQEANASFAASLGAAVIVHQHDPAHFALENALNRLLKTRLVQGDSSLDPLIKMQQGMERLAVRDSEKKIAKLLQKFS